MIAAPLPVPAVCAALALLALVGGPEVVGPATAATDRPPGAHGSGATEASAASGPTQVAQPAAATRGTDYRVPVGSEVLRLFDPPEVRWGSGHRGIDLGATPGAAVVAPADGVVTVAGTVVDRGVVTIRHPDGLRSSLEPVAPSVRSGDVVAAGDPVGALTDRPAHPGLHWGVRAGETYLDPLALLPDAGPVVLLAP